MQVQNNAKIVISILSFCALIVVSQLYISIPLTEVFSRYFSVSTSFAVWMGSAFGFSYATGFLFFGPLSDRFGRKAIIMPGLLVLGIITLCIGFTQSFQTLVLLRLIQGFVVATFAPAALAFIGEQMPINLRSTAIACVSTGFMTAGVLGQLYASQINLYYGWQAIFFSLGVAYCVMGIVIKIWVHETVQPNKTVLNLKLFFKDMLSHIKDINLLSAYLCSFVLLFSFVAMYSAISTDLIVRFHFMPEDLFHVRLLGLLGMVVAPISGKLITTFGNKNILYIGFILAVISILVEGLVPVNEIAIIATIPFVAGIGISAPALISYISISATKAKGAAISLYTFMLFIGAATGSLFANHLKIYEFKIITITIALLLFIAITTFFLLTQTRIKENQI